MKLYACQACGQLLFFENSFCESCGAPLGFLPERLSLVPLKEEANGWSPLGPNEDVIGVWKACANAAHGLCNWMISADDPNDLCQACRLNRTIPDLSDPGNLRLWRRTELAKHRLVYALIRLGLPLASMADRPETGFAFDFLVPSDSAGTDDSVTTGHASGLITINLAEADPAERERVRQDMEEPYRTMLGHFRHEIGHYYWERLVRDGGPLEDYRAVFGDERQDYQEALQAHYGKAHSNDWQASFVSAYASAHPWEDFAETWAHYLHIVDTLETAQSFGVSLAPKVGTAGQLDLPESFDPYRSADLQNIIDAWLPLTYAVNSLNKSMGQPDLYPFVLTEPVIQKLAFVHRLIGAYR